jgi:hypothetical protein
MAANHGNSSAFVLMSLLGGGWLAASDWLAAKLLLTLMNTVTFGSEFHGTNDPILHSGGFGGLQRPSYCDSDSFQCLTSSQSRSHIMTNSQLSPKTRYLLLSDSWGFVHVSPVIYPYAGPHIKRRFQQFFCCCLHIHCHGHMFIKPLPSSGWVFS